MPFGMDEKIQSVLVDEIVYVGGGHADTDINEHIVMTYDTRSGRWGTLPPYRTHYFGMAVIRHQLVLVGGMGKDFEHSKSLGVWRTDSEKWLHNLYPDMSIPRTNSSVVTYNEWLIVAGGSNKQHILSSVEIMNIDTEQWYFGQPAPGTFLRKKTAIVGDMCYYMGGFLDGRVTEDVYRVYLPALISTVKSDSFDHQIWDTLYTPDVKSTPLSIGGHLLAFGGMVLRSSGGIQSGTPLTSILRYQTDTNKWVKVGDMPSHRYNFTCFIVNNGDILIAGGRNRDTDPLPSCEIASFM